MRASAERTRWIGTAQEQILASFRAAPVASLSTAELIDLLHRRGQRIPLPSIYRALKQLSRSRFLISEGRPKRYLLTPPGRALASLAVLVQTHREPNRLIRTLANECYQALANA